MSEAEQHNVTFQSDMTLQYADAEGEMKFTFELGPSSRPKALFLYRNPFDTNFQQLPVSVSGDRKDLAFERTLTYLKSLSYEVEVIEK